MRAIRRVVTAFLLLIAAPLRADTRFADSPHLEPLPDAPCDTVVTTSLASSALLQSMLNDPTRRVFCVQPGDYRAAGRVTLNVSGTAEAPRILRFNADDDVRNAVEREQRATFEALYIRASHWVVHGLSFRPRDATTPWFVTIWGGDHNLIDGNLIDGAEQPNAGINVGVMVSGYQGDPATHNTVQANLIRNGNASRAPVDYTGISIQDGVTPTESNDFNKVLDNEVADWGDGISVEGRTMDCSEPAMARGTIVDGNDVYVTSAKRVDCATGDADPEGECACAENGIDVKSDPGPDPALWTRITNNRVWGYRPTSSAGHCGGSGANGQAVTAGNDCPGHTLVAGNLISDSTIGLTVSGETWIVARNLLHDIRISDGTGPYSSLAIQPTAQSRNVWIEFNTIVATDMSYDDQSAYTETQCNAVIDDRVVPVATLFRGPFHTTERNFLYDAQQPNIQGSTNEHYATADQSGNAPYCYWRKRWSGPERVCVSFGATTPASRHAPAAAACDRDLGAAFGMPPLDFVPEPDAGTLGAGVALALASLARRARSDGITPRG